MDGKDSRGGVGGEGTEDWGGKLGLLVLFPVHSRQPWKSSVNIMEKLANFSWYTARHLATEEDRGVS